ncbi:MAG: response regulator transcription factor [Lachnospiraceae bacterium]|nr:response regulator transcription factor [Lachnospiraceae bacterium]
MSIKVMLADDHILCREGIRQLLEYDGSIEVICEVSDGEACLNELSIIMPDVLLLDINMPKKNGIDVLIEIRKRKYPVKVLMLTVHNEVDYLLKAVDLGVEGYMVKDSESVELKKAIKSLFRGGKYIQPSLVPLMNNRLLIRTLDKEKVASLTKREKEMLIYITKGMFNKEIAIELNISERTVKNHISNLFKKIDVNDRTQAAVFAIKNDLAKLY